MRPELRAWDESRARNREVWFDGRAIRTAQGVIALWNPNRDVLVPALEPSVGLSAPLLAAFLAQLGPREPREVAAFLDAHIASLRASG